jgi:hypothetical protein
MQIALQLCVGAPNISIFTLDAGNESAAVQRINKELI